MTTQMRGLEAVAWATGPWHGCDALADRIASAVAPILRRYNIGVELDSVLEYLRRAATYVKTLGREISDPRNDRPDVDAPPTLPCIHSGRMLPRILGLAILTAGYEHRIDPSRRMDAFAAQVLYEVQQNVLDDLVDDGGYSFDQVRALYRLCSERAEGPIPDHATLRTALAELLREDHRVAAPILASISIELAERLRASPRSSYLAHQMALENDAVVQAQAATVYLREHAFNLKALKAHVESLWSPEPDAGWSDRLAGHSAWVSYDSLIGLCFVDSPPTPSELDAHRTAWYGLDTAMSFFDHVAGIEKDRKDGVLNFAAAIIADARGVEDPERLSWTRPELESILERAAAAAELGISCAQRGLDHERGFYPMLAAMSAVVLCAPGSGNESWCLPTFLSLLESRTKSRIPREQESMRGREIARVRSPFHTVLAARIALPHAARLGDFPRDMSR